MIYLGYILVLQLSHYYPFPKLFYFQRGRILVIELLFTINNCIILVIILYFMFSIKEIIYYFYTG